MTPSLQEAKIQLLENPEKTARYDKIINELCHFYKVSLIKTGLMFHKYHLLNQLQVFMRYKKITEMSFNIPLSNQEISLFAFFWEGNLNDTSRGPIIAKLHVTRESTQIFGPFFADGNNKW